jgi:hypothetical protein
VSELGENIQELIETETNNSLNTKVALCVAICATFLAICNIKGGNMVQAMAQVQAKSVNYWSYYQAKSNKQLLLENSLELLQAQSVNISEELLMSYHKRIETYNKEKLEIKSQAEDYEKQYDDLNVFDDQFDMTEAFISIAIALFGITALTQKSWLLYFSVGLGLLGMVLGVTAFMGISLHSDFISGLLG